MWTSPTVLPGWLDESCDSHAPFTPRDMTAVTLAEQVRQAYFLTSSGAYSEVDYSATSVRVTQRNIDRPAVLSSSPLARSKCSYPP